MLADLRIIHNQLLSRFKFSLVIVQGLIVEPANNLFLLVVADPDAHPHPLTDAGTLVGKLHLDVVASLVLGHDNSHIADFSPSILNQLGTARNSRSLFGSRRSVAVVSSFKKPSHLAAQRALIACLTFPNHQNLPPLCF